MSNFDISSIGIIHSCYKEKFGIPRQPGLVSSPATIEIHSEYSQDEAFRELESFSHIWVIFIFHAINNDSWKSTVRPPRLGGNQRVGVFATRSMYRPNPLGLSVVELNSIERVGNNIVLNIVGGDFLNGTPVVDVKPYLPYVDSVSSANAGYAIEQPCIKFEVVFSSAVMNEISSVKNKHPNLEKIIKEILQLDPRPAYKKKDNKEYAIRLYEYDLKWHIEENTIIVTSLTL